MDGGRFRVQPLQTTVTARQTFIRAAQGVSLGGQPAGHEQFRLARHQVHGLGAQPFREQGPPCGGAPRAAGQHDDHGQADDQHPAAQCKAKPGRHHADHHRGQQRRTQRRGGRHQQAEIEGVQRIQVRGQPEQRPCRTAQQVLDAGALCPAAEEAFTQLRQRRQGGVMGDEPLAIARHGAAQRQQPDAGRWRKDIEGQRGGGLQPGNGGCRDEPSRQAQQAHAGQHRHGSQHGAPFHACRRAVAHRLQGGQGGTMGHAILRRAVPLGHRGVFPC